MKLLTVFGAFALSFLMVWICPGWAQEDTRAQQIDNAIQSQKPSEDYVKLVKEWAKITDFAQSAASVAVEKISKDLMKDPKFKNLVTPALKADLKQFFYEQFSSPEMMIHLAALYQKYFTLEEMMALINFYNTPLGQKVVQSNEALVLQSQQMASDLLKKHEQEYMKIIAKYIVNKK
ncbi:MAG: DUF2059 domain-containing protein [Candidatus Berkiella sp.]